VAFKTKVYIRIEVQIENIFMINNY